VVHEVSVRGKEWIEIVSGQERPRPKGFYSHYGDRCVSSRLDTGHEVSVRGKQGIVITPGLEMPRPKGF
jgi:hypothetical protein